MIALDGIYCISDVILLGYFICVNKNPSYFILMNEKTETEVSDRKLFRMFLNKPAGVYYVGKASPYLKKNRLMNFTQDRSKKLCFLALQQSKCELSANN